MGVKTNIEWCDSTSNPLVGCDGCELWNPKEGGTCYAAGLVARYAGQKGWPKQFGRPEFFLDRIDQAIGWKDLTGTERPNKPWLNGQPRIIFLCDMADPFCESVPIDWLAPHLEKIDASQHVWLLLTKRPSRMKEFAASHKLPSNLWLGTSGTSPKSALLRMSELSLIDHPHKFVSLEPLIATLMSPGFSDFDASAVGWVIVGGESGQAARPMDPAWARELRDKCQAAGVPFFFKQWGEWVPLPHDPEIQSSAIKMVRVGKQGAGRRLDERTWLEVPRF